MLQWNVESQQNLIYCVDNGILLNYKMTFLWEIVLLFGIGFGWFMGCCIFFWKKYQITLHHVFVSSSSIPSPFSDLPQSHHETGRKWVISVAVPLSCRSCPEVWAVYFLADTLILDFCWIGCVFPPWQQCNFFPFHHSVWYWGQIRNLQTVKVIDCNVQFLFSKNYRDAEFNLHL